MTKESCRTSRRTCLTATLFTTNLTLTGLGLKLGLHGDRPATNGLSLGKAPGTKKNSSYLTVKIALPTG
jgi:hypothetical protein